MDCVLRQQDFANATQLECPITAWTAPNVTVHPVVPYLDVVGQVRAVVMDSV